MYLYVVCYVFVVDDLYLPLVVSLISPVFSLDNPEVLRVVNVFFFSSAT